MIEKKLTIIVLLKGRPHFTKRIINFYIKSNLKYNLFFADGGKKSIYKEDLKILKKNQVKFIYKKFRFDKNLNIFIKKISSSLDLIKTKYTMLFDNDDIPLNFTINQCLLKLEKNKDLRGCGGYLVNFQLLKHYAKNNNCEGEMINFSKMKYGNYYNSNDKYNRVKNYYVKKDINTFNDIFHTNYLRKTYSIISKFRFNYLYFYFILADSLNYYSGKVLKLNLPFAFHQSHEESYSIKNLSILEVIRSKKFLSEKQLFYEKFDRIFKDKKIFIYVKNYFKILEKKAISHNHFKIRNNKLNFVHFNKFKYILKKICKPLVSLPFCKFKNKHFNEFNKLYKNKNIRKQFKNIFMFLKNR